jgi:hypothetical protein
MTGPFPNSANGGVVPSAAPHAYTPTAPNCTTAPTFYANGCLLQLTPEVMNSLISEMLCVVDKSTSCWDTASNCNLYNAIEKLIAASATADAVATVTANADGSKTVSVDGVTFVVPPVTATPAAGGLLGVQTLTQSGNYTPTAGTKGIIIEMIGGGGAGGCGGLNQQGQGGNTTYTATWGNGGSSGSWLKAYIANPAATAFTIGKGGAGAITAVNTNGADGGDTIFGALIAKGGHGGMYSGLGSTNLPGGQALNLVNSIIPASPMSAGMLFSAQGNQPLIGEYYTAVNTATGVGAATNPVYTTGAPSPYGQGGFTGRWGNPAVNGSDGGTGAGGGAGSGWTPYAYPGAFSSGSGGDGLIIIYEYA